MRIVVAADHAGYPLVELAQEEIRKAGHEPVFVGTHHPELPDDYPDFVQLACERLLRGEAERAIVLCGSGVGASITANKFPGVRAGLCHDHYSAGQGVEHDEMNVLCLGSRVIGTATAKDVLQAFLQATFSGEERHVRRLGKVRAIEEHYLKTAQPAEAVTSPPDP